MEGKVIENPKISLQRITSVLQTSNPQTQVTQSCSGLISTAPCSYVYKNYLWVSLFCLLVGQILKFQASKQEYTEGVLYVILDSNLRGKFFVAEKAEVITLRMYVGGTL